MKIFDIIPKKTTGREDDEEISSAPVREVAEPSDTSYTVGKMGGQAVDVFRMKEQRPPLLEELQKKIRRRLMVPAWFVLGAVVLLGVLGALTFIYPRVSVNVTAKKAEVPLEFFLTIDGQSKTVAPTEGKIPGKFFTLNREITRTFPASGKEKAVAKARGVITIFNAFSAKTQTLVATTRFQAPDGKIFRLLKTTTVPGALTTESSVKPASIAAEVEADRPGPAYNIGPTDFTIPGLKGSAKFTGFYGKSEAAMKGGAEGETRVVKENDLAEARRVLREELTAALTDELRRKLSEGWEIFPDGIKSEIVIASPSAAPGTAAENFQMRFALALTAGAYRPADLKVFLAQRVGKTVDAPSRQSINLVTMNAQDIRLDDKKQTLSALVKAVVKVEALLEPQEIRQAILGKREQALKDYLRAQEGIQAAKVIFWPFWVKRVPRREGFVSVTID